MLRERVLITQFQADKRRRVVRYEYLRSCNSIDSAINDTNLPSYFFAAHILLLLVFLQKILRFHFVLLLFKQIIHVVKLGNRALIVNRNFGQHSRAWIKDKSVDAWIRKRNLWIGMSLQAFVLHYRGFV